MTVRPAGRRTIRVAHWPLSADLERHSFITLLSRAVRQESIELTAFRPRSIIKERPDVIHVHWPEHALGSGIVNRARAIASLGSIWWARRRGSILVHTAHNLAPHDRTLGFLSERYLQQFDRMVDRLIVMSRSGHDALVKTRPFLGKAEWSHIRHGHFRPLFDRLPSKSQARSALGIQPGRPLVVFAGQVRPYKGVPDLVSAIQGLDVDLLVAGKCLDADLRRQLEAAAEANGRIHLCLEYLSLDELGTVLRAADVVALPYRHVFNSGSLLLALSADRRVLVPSTPTFEELASEVGRGWVHTFDTPRLTASALWDVVTQRQPEGSPDLSLYSWETVATATRAVYDQLPSSPTHSNFRENENEVLT